MHISPHIVSDELAFGYDTGYGYNNNNNKTVYYQGQPTVNLVSDPVNMSGWSSYSSGNDGTFLTEFGTIGYKINRRNTWNGIVKGVGLPSPGTYTISAWFRIRGKSSGNNGINVYTSGGGIGDTAAGGDDGLFGEWQRISMTRTYTGTSFNFYIISWGGTSGVDWSSWDVTMPQVEAGSVLTPFANGTRSNTTALIDTARAHNLSVDRASFDSSGQPTFDGTNDTIWVQSGTDLNPPAAAFSVEHVFYCTNAGVSEGILHNKEDLYEAAVKSGYLQYAWQPHWNWDGGTSCPISSNTWYHVVVTYDGANQRVYRNGVEMYSRAQSGNIGSNGNTLSFGARSVNTSGGGGYSYFPGYIPVSRGYYKTLSATEVYQNYLAYRKRFSLS